MIGPKSISCDAANLLAAPSLHDVVSTYTYIGIFCIARCTAGRTIESKNPSNVVADESHGMILQRALANGLVFDREILAQQCQRA